MKKKEPIYLDQDGYNALLQEIEDIKAAIRENNMGRKDAYDAGAGDGWDSPEFEEIERINARLNGELQCCYENLQRIVIVEKHNNQDVVDIGDTIVADMIFTPDDIEKMTLKLVATSGKSDAEIPEVSINSPLGSSIYKRKIGDTCSYSVNGNTFTVCLKQKLSLKKENNVLIKELKK